MVDPKEARQILERYYETVSDEQFLNDLLQHNPDIVLRDGNIEYVDDPRYPRFNI